MTFNVFERDDTLRLDITQSHNNRPHKVALLLHCLEFREALERDHARPVASERHKPPDFVGATYDLIQIDLHLAERNDLS